MTTLELFVIEDYAHAEGKNLDLLSTWIGLASLIPTWDGNLEETNPGGYLAQSSVSEVS